MAPIGARMSVEQLAPGFEAKTGYKIKGTYDAATDVRYGAARGWVDKIIDPAQTREELVFALELATRHVEPEPFRGEIQALSATHVEGWVQSVGAPQRRVPFEAVLPGSGRIVAYGNKDAGSRNDLFLAGFDVACAHTGD